MYNLGIFGLTIAFTSLTVLLLSLHLKSHWPPVIKAFITFSGVMLCALTYISYPGLLGWPAQEKTLPSQLFLLAVEVEEPNYIYLWGRDLDAGLSNARPRAYEIPYSTKTHHDAEGAGSKLKRGLPVIVKRLAEGAARPDLKKSDESAEGALIEFVEAPEGLIPEKE